MSGGRFIVLRPFLLNGARVEKDRVITLDDGELIADLLISGKIAAGDKPTEKRIRWNSVRSGPQDTQATGPRGRKIRCGFGGRRELTIEHRLSGCCAGEDRRGALLRPCRGGNGGSLRTPW